MKTPSPWANRSPQRFKLSARGFATAALCPKRPAEHATDGSWERLHSERAQWAYAHGLQPLDGAYLCELRRRPLTLSQLGEALAVLGQTSQMVALAVAQLGGLGLVEPAPGSISDDRGAPRQDVEAELSAALDDLQHVLRSVENQGELAHRTAGVKIRRAVGRALAARRFAREHSTSDSARRAGRATDSTPAPMMSAAPRLGSNPTTVDSTTKDSASDDS